MPLHPVALWAVTVVRCRGIRFFGQQRVEPVDAPAPEVFVRAEQLLRPGDRGRIGTHEPHLPSARLVMSRASASTAMCFDTAANDIA